MPVPRLRTTTAVLALALIAGAPTGTALAASHVKPVAAKPAEAAKTAPAHHNYRAARLIDLFDIDGNGKVSVAEINGDQKRFFTAIDVDGDGKLSTDEFKRRARSLAIFMSSSLFDLLDVDGDGKLSVAEIQGPSKRWFSRYDANKDGQLEANEIPAGRRFRRGRRRAR